MKISWGRSTERIYPIDGHNIQSIDNWFTKEKPPESFIMGGQELGRHIWTELMFYFKDGYDMISRCQTQFA